MKVAWNLRVVDVARWCFEQLGLLDADAIVRRGLLVGKQECIRIFGMLQIRFRVQ
jgi:hypothetical protein